MIGVQAGGGTLWGGVLAAGASSRMGQSKALLRWGPESLVELAFRLLRAAGIGHVMVALREQDLLVLEQEPPLAEAVREGLLSFVTPSPGGPLSDSLRCLVEACDAEAMVLHQVDRPFVTPDQLVRMVQLFQQHRLPVAARCGKVYMPPVVLPMTLRPVVQSLTGDVGLAALFRSGAIEHVAACFDYSHDGPVPDRDRHFGFDVDTPSDWESALKLRDCVASFVWGWGGGPGAAANAPGPA